MAIMKNKSIGWETIPSLVHLIKELNIKRVGYTAMIFIFFEILNFINPPLSDLYFENNAVHINLAIYNRAGTLMLFIINVIYLIGVKVFYKKITANNILTKIVYLSYWGMLFVGITPFFIRDIIVSDYTLVISAMNITLLLTLLVMMPVFSRIELIAMYTSFFVYNIIIMIICSASVQYVTFVFGLYITIFIIAFFVQHRYINMIVELNLEVRIDFLTGIMNRRGGIDKIHTVYELVKRQNVCMVVYMIDIDHFKYYNDQYGHPAGDVVLKRVAEAITKTYGRASDVICRYGGEEFLVCSVIHDTKDAVLLAEKLQDNISELKIKASDKSIYEYLTVSIGYVVYNSTSNYYRISVDELIDIADKALYEAKNTGRNKVSSKDLVGIDDIDPGY